ncbi:MAG: hypothetical protein IPP74_00510 [Alphaproteobacteria bacterium]|nr:hypothetical protein [Alphaproteobacteria bacterium]
MKESGIFKLKYFLDVHYGFLIESIDTEYNNQFGYIELTAEQVAKKKQFKDYLKNNFYSDIEEYFEREINGFSEEDYLKRQSEWLKPFLEQEIIKNTIELVRNDKSDNNDIDFHLNSLMNSIKEEKYINNLVHNLYNTAEHEQYLNMVFPSVPNLPRSKKELIIAHLIKTSLDQLAPDLHNSMPDFKEKISNQLDFLERSTGSEKNENNSLANLLSHQAQSSSFSRFYNDFDIQPFSISPDSSLEESLKEISKSLERKGLSITFLDPIIPSNDGDSKAKLRIECELDKSQIKKIDSTNISSRQLNIINNNFENTLEILKDVYKSSSNCNSHISKLHSFDRSITVSNMVQFLLLNRLVFCKYMANKLSQFEKNIITFKELIRSLTEARRQMAMFSTCFDVRVAGEQRTDRLIKIEESIYLCARDSIGLCDDLLIEAYQYHINNDVSVNEEKNEIEKLFQMSWSLHESFRNNRRTYGNKHYSDDIKFYNTYLLKQLIVSNSGAIQYCTVADAGQASYDLKRIFNSKQLAKREAKRKVQLASQPLVILNTSQEKDLPDLEQQRNSKQQDIPSNASAISITSNFDSQVPTSLPNRIASETKTSQQRNLKKTNAKQKNASVLRIVTPQGKTEKYSSHVAKVKQPPSRTLLQSNLITEESFTERVLKERRIQTIRDIFSNDRFHTVKYKEIVELWKFLNGKNSVIQDGTSHLVFLNKSGEAVGWPFRPHGGKTTFGKKTINEIRSAFDQIGFGQEYLKTIDGLSQNKIPCHSKIAS